MKRLSHTLGALTLALGTLALSATSAAAQDADGKALYDASCKKCHGALGVPPKAMKTKFPKLAAFDAAFIAKNSRDDIVKALTKGTSADMKSFKDKLSAAEMAAVASHVHELGGGKEK